MKNILSQPYPYYNNASSLLKNSLGIFVAVFLFLYLFTPFSVNYAEHRVSYFLICVIHALSATLVYALFFLLFNFFFDPAAREETWKVYHAISTTAVLFLFIGTASFLIRPLIYNNADNFSLRYFRAETINTFLAGSLIFAGFVFVDFYRLVKKNKGTAAGLEKEILNHPGNGIAVLHPDSFITLTTETGDINVNLDELLFVQATGNYANFYCSKEGLIVKSLYRLSLKSLETQLADHSKLIRTHRSYLVNTAHICRMSGNAQGFQLFFPGVAFAVPVSRAHLPAFRQTISVC